MTRYNDGSLIDRLQNLRPVAGISGREISVRIHCKNIASTGLKKK